MENNTKRLFLSLSWSSLHNIHRRVDYSHAHHDNMIHTLYIDSKNIR